MEEGRGELQPLIPQMRTTGVGSSPSPNLMSESQLLHQKNLVRMCYPYSYQAT